MRSEILERRELCRAFGAVLGAARHQLGVSQEKLAELCSFDRTYVSLVERGLREPRLGTVMRLANGLGIKATQLVGDTVERLGGIP